ncbi:MAG: tetratricopeptide repeat protein [Muribaculum sp.]|nr:tetratricopeptide repeat protein [Muribaculaceae bacterium]MCM1080891.1 tetratricopeptide repeat protein [Muribaculum sp.]
MRYIICLLASFYFCFSASAQINTDQVMRIGQNSLYLEDYVLAIQYFNQVISVKPRLAQPYFYRSIAKISLEDYLGAEADASKAIELNPFISGAYEVRGVARHNMGRAGEAVADYDKALEQLPESKGLLLNKALALEDIDSLDQAEVVYTTLLRIHPRYDNGYVARARLYLQKGDTTAALADVEKTIQLNKNNVNAYVIRADISISRGNQYKEALADMDEAIKLQPQFAGFFVNRAFLRYKLDDYFGAMADFDYAIQLDPLSVPALFNRGMLRAEVHDNNKAISDFSEVLKLEPDNYKAMFNRALLFSEIGEYQSAVNDLDRVVERFPEFAGAYFARCEAYRMMGQTKKAERDYNRSMALSKSPVQYSDDEQSTAHEETQQQVSNRFSSLLTVADNASVKEEYQTQGIKGKVQNRNMQIEIEPMFTLSYYVITNELQESPYYIKEVDDINSTRILRFGLMVTNHPPQLTDEETIDKHFASIRYYDSYMNTHQPRALDYFGRAMDQYTLHNYTAAIADLDKAIELTPDFTMAYFVRALARHEQATTAQALADDENKPSTLPAPDASRLVRAEIVADLDRVAELSPRTAFPYFNLGNIAVEAGDLTSALSHYSKAIEVKPDLGEAYYNRGYVYLKLGNKNAGIADLSKAGELGIVPSYNLLKRMSR